MHKIIISIIELIIQMVSRLYNQGSLLSSNSRVYAITAISVENRPSTNIALLIIRIWPTVALHSRDFSNGSRFSSFNIEKNVCACMSSAATLTLGTAILLALVKSFSFMSLNRESAAILVKADGRCMDLLDPNSLGVPELGGDKQ